MMTETTNVADRIQQLLDRVGNVRRASDLPTRFDERGEAAARAIADRDRTTQDRENH